MPKTSVLATTVLVLASVAAGCGGSSKSSSSASSGGVGASQSMNASAPPPSTRVLTEAADPSGQLKFTKSSLSAKAGKVTIHFTNHSPFPHNFSVQASGGAIVGATGTFSGGTQTLTVNLKPGTYTFFCSVPGHRQSGMRGTLNVS